MRIGLRTKPLSFGREVELREHTQAKGKAMSRRIFLKSLMALTGSFALPAVARAAANRNNAKTLQHSPLAGFQYHHSKTLWPHHAVRPELVEGQLARKAGNRYDNRAVRVEWQGHKLGYIPRLDNAAMSQLLDRGEMLEAAIIDLENSINPCNRIKVEVRWLV